jgi:rhodanese-related sulfurtransferase
MSTRREIGREELRGALARREGIKLVMASSEWGFRAKHIPGSLHFKSAAEMFAALRKDEPIIVYCSNADCHASIGLYEALTERGYTDVRHYAGGLLDWEGAGLPIEGTWAAGPVATT